MSKYISDEQLEKYLEEESKKNSLVIFNKDFGNTPCFRNSFLYGLESGIGGALAYFLYSSNVRMSTHVGFGTYVAVTLSYWCYCRWNFSKKRFQYAQINSLLKKQAIYEGTEEELRLEKEQLEKTFD